MQKWPVAAKVMLLKGDMSYREFSEDIFRKTKKRLSHITLRQLAIGARMGKPESIAILAEYANRPISWLYESESPPTTIDEACEEYLVPTGNQREDDRRRQLLQQFRKTGMKMNLQTLEQFVKWAKAIAADDAKSAKRS